MEKETRFSSIETRSDGENNKMIVEGYAIVFDEETLIGDENRGFIEVIDRNALAETNMKDVPFKYNHNDVTLILARTRNGSLSLEVDDKGLKIRAELIDTTSNVDIYKSFEPDTLYDVEDSSHGLITFENGAGLMYQAAWSINAEDVDDRLEVYGSKGGLVKNPCKRISEEATGMTVTSIMAKENNCYTAQLEDFARVIKGEHASRTPVEDGLQIQKILNGLYLSAKTGKEVEL